MILTLVLLVAKAYRKRNCLFSAMVGKKHFFLLFFWVKMCVLCMFYVDCELGGVKKLWGRDFFE